LKDKVDETKMGYRKSEKSVYPRLEASPLYFQQTYETCKLILGYRRNL